MSGLGIFRKNNYNNSKILDTNLLEISEPINTSLYSDNCNVLKNTQESMRPGLYHLQDQINFNPCQMDFPGYNSRTFGAISIDIESELKTLSIKNSKCSENILFNNPLINCKACDNCNKAFPCNCAHCTTRNKSRCDTQLIPEFTRELKSCNDITSINVNRFEVLQCNPQEIKSIQNNSYIGRQTRNEMKDLTKNIRTNK